MKLLLVITLLLASTAAASAQATAQTAPQGVVVVKFSWYDDTHRKGWDEPVFSAKDKTDMTPDPSVLRTPNRPANPAQDPASNPNRTLAAPLDPKAEAPPKIEQYVYQVKVKNEGALRVEALDWDYIFVDAVTQKELGHHRFRSFVRINPEGTSTLMASSSAPPAKIVSARSLEKDSRKPFVEKVVIKCVAYSDGSLWKNPSVAEGNCKTLTARRDAKK